MVDVPPAVLHSMEQLKYNENQLKHIRMEISFAIQEFFDENFLLCIGFHSNIEILLLEYSKLYEHGFSYYGK